MITLTSKHLFVLKVIFIAWILTACGSSRVAMTPKPTLTTELLAVIINDEGISDTEFEAELTRYMEAQTALGITITTEEATPIVLDDIIEQVLFAQGASEAGFTLDEAALQARIDSLAAQIGGQESLTTWETQHGYTDETFRQSLRRQIATAWMRDQITSKVPDSIEQVSVRQILLYNEKDAQSTLMQLQAGTDFEQLAASLDPITQGNLGWFPRGYLLEPALEHAAFSLQPGEFSDIIKTQIGYHIIVVIEHDPNHPLSPDALLVLQERALEDWLSQERNESTIILAP